MPRRSKSNRSSVPTKPKEDKPLSKFVKSEMKRSKDDTSTKRKRCYSEHAKKRDTEKSKAYLLLMDDKYFGVSLPYGECTEDFKKMVKKYQGTWCSLFKTWRLPIMNYEFVRDDLPVCASSLDLEEPPAFVKQAMTSIGSKLQVKPLHQTIIYETCTSAIGENPLYEKLYPFQRQTLQFSRVHQGRLLIGDEMGVGKTVQSLACSLEYLSDYPMLVICPSALKTVWLQEIGKWLKDVFHKHQVIMLHHGKNLPLIAGIHVKIIIASYEIATSCIKSLHDCQIVICDEAHYLKNSSTHRSEVLVPYLMSRKRVLMLTGTPALAEPKELFNILHILRPDIYVHEHEYCNRYCLMRRNTWSRQMEYHGSKNSAELHYLLKKIMVRRLKSQVILDLPAKQRQIVMLEADKAVCKQINRIMREDNAIPIDNLRSSEKLFKQWEQTPSLGQCYQLTGIAKLAALKDYIAAVLKNDVKVIIFAHHMVVMDELQLYLKTIAVGLVRIDGNVTMQIRSNRVKSFQNEDTVQVALLSITAAGVGITLTAASTVIFAQLHWTPAYLLQAEDRAHRIGQNSCVNVHYLIGEDTVDGLMLRNLQRKLEVVGKVLDANCEGLQLELVAKGTQGKISKSNYKSNSKGSQPVPNKITNYFPSLTYVERTAGEQIDTAPALPCEDLDDTLLLGLLRKRKGVSQDKPQ